MTDPKSHVEYASRDSSRWLWLGSFTAIALISLSNGKLLLAAGMLLLAVFATFNNPLRPNAAKAAASFAGHGDVVGLRAAGRAGHHRRRRAMTVTSASYPGRESLRECQDCGHAWAQQD